MKSDLLTKVAQRANDQGIVFLLDAEVLLAGHGDASPASVVTLEQGAQK